MLSRLWPLLLVLFASFASSSDGSTPTGMAQVISEPQQILPQVIPEILEEGENVSLNLDCSTLSQPDRDLKRFIMESLDVESQETLDDLKTPSCRAAFDMACEFLPREKMAQLLKNPEGLNTLRAGHCLRSFSDFVDFDLSTFALFPDLKISEIQHWETIKPEVLLGLISSVDYASIGRIELFPERVGMNPLSHKAWIEHPTIWQLFLIEGVINLPPAHKQEFANFMADSRKLERLIQGPSTASSEPQVSPRKNWITSVTPPLCDTLSNNAAVLARWAIQCEEFMVTLIDRSDTESCQMIAPLIETLMKARENVFMQVHKCEQSNHHKERLSMLRLFLHYPITLRFREALNAIYSQTPDNSVTLTKMTRHLKGLITNFDVLFSFYDNTRGLLPTTFEHTDLLGYFLHFNGVSSLDDIFGEDAQFSGGENERILLSISIRRLLLMLLTPNQSQSIIQKALEYVLKAPDNAGSSSLLRITENEALYWFQQAADMFCVPILDRLIVSFGHEFNVSAHIKRLLRTTEARDKLFEQSQSSLVILLAAFKVPEGRALKYDHQLTFVDPSDAFLIQKKLVHQARSRTESQADADVQNHGELQATTRPTGPLQASAADAVSDENEAIDAHNQLIQKALSESVNILHSISTNGAMLKSFTHPNFEIRFHESPGVDAGGLRRAWISAISCIFGDPERKLFNQVDELPGVGMLPSPFISREVMMWVGLLNGKALQIGTKPSWYFLPQFAELIFERAGPSELSEDDSSTQQQDDEDEDDLPRADTPITIDVGDSFATIVDDDDEAWPPEMPPLTRQFAVDVSMSDVLSLAPLQPPPSSASDTADQEASAELGPDFPYYRTSVDKLKDLIPSFYPDIFFTFRTILEAEFPEDSAVDYFNDSGYPVLSALADRQHSVSRSFEFNEAFWANHWPDRPVVQVQNRQGIVEYRDELIDVIAENLLAGIAAYRSGLFAFFDPRYLEKGIGLERWLTWLTPVQVTIEEIFERLSFGQESETIMVIDDSAELESECERCELESETGREPELEKDVSSHADQMDVSLDATNVDDSLSQDLQDASADTIMSPKRLPLITAKEALKRILVSKFVTPQLVQAFLFFATGSPQLPAPGLEGLRIQIHALNESPTAVLSTSHTCSQLVDFVVSERYSVTAERFFQSVTESSGFEIA